MTAELEKNGIAIPDVAPVKASNPGFLPRGLSGKLLVLTALFIMLAEILVFVPSVANYRLTWLARHFTTGEAASLAIEKLDQNAISDEIRQQLLALTQTNTIVVRRDGASRILAEIEMPSEVARHVELRAPGRAEALRSITQAFDTLLFGGDRIIRVFGPMEQRTGTLELVMKEKPLRDAMLSYAANVLVISFIISFATALLVFMTLRWILIRPMQRMTRAMLAFAEDPEDPKSLVEPTGRRDEIGVAEEQLSSMQRQLRGTIQQQRHLADLGLAVSKINHDLRNILAAASLFSDRLANVSDPTVQRLAPRLVRTIDRAADYTKSVLAYSKAGEAPPERSVLLLYRLGEDVADALTLDGENKIHWENKVPEDLEVEADAEQLYRVLLNLSRNAVQAMQDHARQDNAKVLRLTLEAGDKSDYTWIHVIDTGPGFPKDAGEKLFSAFHTSGKNGGTGLGLAIAAELIRAHGGSIKLQEHDGPGARFEITLPKSP